MSSGISKSRQCLLFELCAPFVVDTSKSCPIRGLHPHSFATGSSLRNSAFSQPRPTIPSCLDACRPTLLGAPSKLQKNLPRKLFLLTRKVSFLVTKKSSPSYQSRMISLLVTRKEILIGHQEGYPSPSWPQRRLSFLVINEHRGLYGGCMELEKPSNTHTTMT